MLRTSFQVGGPNGVDEIYYEDGNVFMRSTSKDGKAVLRLLTTIGVATVEEGYTPKKREPKKPKAKKTPEIGSPINGGDMNRGGRMRSDNRGGK